jgi:hypothetical protein
MAHPSTRRWAAVATVATALFALTACGGGGGGDPTPTGTDDGSGTTIGGAATPTDTTTPDGTVTTTSGGGGGGGSGGGQQGPYYPSDAKTYGLEILKAIGNKDNVRLTALADLNTVNYAQQYQNRNAQWTNTDCGGGGTTTCNYYNQTGDIAMVGMTTAKLGSAGAGVSVYVEGGSYPTDAGNYVLTFGSSWESGSYAKMVALSSNSIANHVQTLPKFSSVSAGITVGSPHPCATNGSKTCVELSQVGGIANLPSRSFIVDMTKISAGKPNGIIGYE